MWSIMSYKFCFVNGITVSPGENFVKPLFSEYLLTKLDNVRSVFSLGDR